MIYHSIHTIGTLLYHTIPYYTIPYTYPTLTIRYHTIPYHTKCWGQLPGIPRTATAAQQLVFVQRTVFEYINSPSPPSPLSSLCPLPCGWHPSTSALYAFRHETPMFMNRLMESAVELDVVQVPISAHTDLAASYPILSAMPYPGHSGRWRGLWVTGLLCRVQWESFDRYTQSVHHNLDFWNVSLVSLV